MFKTASARDKSVLKVLGWILIANLAVAIAKFAVGMHMHALSLIADSVHTLLDASSNVVGIVGLAVASRPPDANHPYGHRRYEALAALLIGGLIASGMVEVLQVIYQSVMVAPHALHLSWSSAGFVALTVVINLSISRVEQTQGKKLKSTLLLADSAHTLTDALAAGVVLLSFAGVALGWSWADRAGALVVALLIGKTAYDVLKTNVRILSDEASLDPYAVYQTVLRVPGVEGAHKIRSRGMDGHVNVDLHIQVDPTLSVKKAHGLSHRVSDAIRQAHAGVIEVIVHTEPADGREKDLSKISPP